MLEDLPAIAAAARTMLTDTSFPVVVMAKVRLQRLLGLGTPAELDETERTWGPEAAKQIAARLARAPASTPPPETQDAP